MDDLLFSSSNIFRHSENDKVISNFFDLPGTIRNDTTNREIFLKPLEMTPNTGKSVGSHLSGKDVDTQTGRP